MSGRTSWSETTMSEAAKRSVNPIRQIVDTLKLQPHPDKPMIPLSIGDPTVFGNFNAPDVAATAIAEHAAGLKKNGYTSTLGYPETREAIAKYVSVPGAEVSSEDIIVASGCSSALEHCITALGSEGQTILVPCPGFCVYETQAVTRGINIKKYNLLPERNWEVDLVHLESLIDSTTCAIVVNNPSNPCGSNFSRAHIRDIIAIAERHFLPIIADEIYADMVFEGLEFVPMATESVHVPILSTGGMAKRFMLPGWRLGWIAVHDRNGVLAGPSPETSVKAGIVKLSQLIIGANTLAQAAVPDILARTPASYYKGVMDQLESNALFIYDQLKEIPGLTPVRPQGAMYLMVGVDMASFPDLKDDFEFVQRLVEEQSVFCLPGRCFHYPNYFRIVVCPPQEKLTEACARIKEFCASHRK